MWAALDGYSAERTERERGEWERARMVAYYSAAPHLKKGKAMKQLIPLPWDNADRPILTQQQIDYLIAKMETIPWRQ